MKIQLGQIMGLCILPLPLFRNKAGAVLGFVLKIYEYT